MTEFVNELIAAGVGLVVGAGLAWYFKSTVTTAVSTDIAAVQADVQALKTKVGL